jgi:hypothetical protein
MRHKGRHFGPCHGGGGRGRGGCAGHGRSMGASTHAFQSGSIAPLRVCFFAILCPWKAIKQA